MILCYDWLINKCLRLSFGHRFALVEPSPLPGTPLSLWTSSTSRIFHVLHLYAKLRLPQEFSSAKAPLFGPKPCLLPCAPSTQVCARHFKVKPFLPQMPTWRALHGGAELRAAQCPGQDVSGVPREHVGRGFSQFGQKKFFSVEVGSSRIVFRKLLGCSDRPQNFFRSCRDYNNFSQYTSSSYNHLCQHYLFFQKYFLIKFLFVLLFCIWLSFLLKLLSFLSELYSIFACRTYFWAFLNALIYRFI